MKLPPQWKTFYLRCIDVPFVGRFFIGPFLRFLWRIIAWFGQDRVPLPLDDARITTYASTIDSLRRQLESMEHRVQRIERELSAARASTDSSSLLLAAALEGLARRTSQLEETVAFQQRMNGAALAALRNRR
jgi:hypothetical protein